jgi:hypothetical protein
MNSELLQLSITGDIINFRGLSNNAQQTTADRQRSQWSSDQRPATKGKRAGERLIAASKRPTIACTIAT